MKIFLWGLKQKFFNQHIIFYYVFSRLCIITGSDYPRFPALEWETNILKLKRTMNHKILLKNMFEQVSSSCKRDFFAPRNISLYYRQAPTQIFSHDRFPLLYMAFLHFFFKFFINIDCLTSTKLLREDQTHSVYLSGYFCEASFYYKWHFG